MKNILRACGFLMVIGFLTAGTFIGCVDTKPKELGSRGKINFTPKDTSNAETFKFNFAYRDTSVVTKIIYIQGAPNTKTTIISTCNAAGSGCVCEFMDASNNIIETTSSSANITLDSKGNYFRCLYTGANPANVRIRNLSSTKYSSILEVDTPASLTIHKLMGDLNLNKVRGVHRYTCLYNFLQKNLTSPTTGSFDCSDQNATPCSGGGSDFCLLQMHYPYYIYSDYLTTNFDKRPIDQLYNSQQGGRICGLQISQYDCTVNTNGAGGTSTNGNVGPTLQFGVYAEQAGVFDTSASFVPGPNQAQGLYGFVAQTNTFGGATVCPPGLVRQILYTATPLQASFPAPNPSSNYPSAGITATEVSAPTTTPSAFESYKMDGGDCSGTSCSFTGGIPALISTQAFATSGSEFCVIPSTLVP